MFTCICTHIATHAQKQFINFAFLYQKGSAIPILLSCVLQRNDTHSEYFIATALILIFQNFYILLYRFYIFTLIYNLY